MWLLICSSDDESALWIASRFRARGLAPLVVVTPEMLHYGLRWVHRVSPRGEVSTAFTLSGDQRIDSRQLRGVLNRMTVVPPAVVAAIAPADRPYAIQEWMALHISWLSGVRAPVLNVPLVHGLCGALRPPSEWTWLAARAGLRTDDFQQHAPSTDADALEHANRAATPRLTPAEYSAYVRTVLVVDGLAIPAGLPDEVESACGRLGELSQTRLIGVGIDTRGWRFVDASARPDLRASGDHIVDVLVDVFGAS